MRFNTIECLRSVHSIVLRVAWVNSNEYFAGGQSYIVRCAAALCFCGNLHQICQQHAHNDTDGGRKQRACQRISGFGNARRHKINRHRVKTGFCAAHQNRRDASCQRICPVGFENIKHQSSRCGRRKQADENEREKLREHTAYGTVSGVFLQQLSRKIQQPGAPQNPDCHHQPDERWDDADDRFQTVRCAVYKVVVEIAFMNPPIADDEEDHGRNEDGGKMCENICHGKLHSAEIKSPDIFRPGKDTILREYLLPEYMILPTHTEPES